MNLLSKYFKTQKNEVALFRVWSFLVMIFIPLYGIILLETDTNATDYLLPRFILSSLWLALLVGSFAFKFLKEQLSLGVFILNNITGLWVVWIVDINHFSPSYCLGLLFTIACTSIISRNALHLIGYILIELSYIAYCLSTSPVLEVNIHVLLLAFSGYYLLSFVIMIQKLGIDDELVTLNQSLRDKNKELEHFAYIASHDLKSPLRTIGSFSGLMRNEINSDNKESQLAYLDFIAGGVDQMTQVIDDLLLYSTTSNKEVEFTTINIQEILFEIKEMLLKNPENAQVTISGLESLPSKMIGNSIQMKQLFQNLIENAIKYNKSEEKKIVISCQESSKKWLFFVKDNGIGISPEYHQKVFEMFNRLHNNSEFKGTGIGLAICKRIVENHKGAFRINSIVGEGATFQFSIAKGLA